MLSLLGLEIYLVKYVAGRKPTLASILIEYSLNWLCNYFVNILVPLLHAIKFYRGYFIDVVTYFVMAVSFAIRSSRVYCRVWYQKDGGRLFEVIRSLVWVAVSLNIYTSSLPSITSYYSPSSSLLLCFVRQVTNSFAIYLSTLILAFALWI